MSELLSWPAALPCPNLGSLVMAPSLGLETMEMESGAVRQRVAGLALGARYRATVTVTRTEYVVLLSFFRKIAGGVFEVSAFLPVELGSALVRLRARFSDAPPADQFGARLWTSQFELILESLSVPDFEALGIIATYGDRAGAVLAAFDLFANNEIPDHAGDV